MAIGKHFICRAMLKAYPGELKIPQKKAGPGWGLIRRPGLEYEAECRLLADCIF